jgi:hypothetical protein
VRVISVDGVARSREARERECPNVQARSRSRFQRNVNSRKISRWRHKATRAMTTRPLAMLLALALLACFGTRHATAAFTQFTPTSAFPNRCASRRARALVPASRRKR